MKYVKLKECSTIIAGQSPESKYYNTIGDGIPFFQGKADFGELYPTVRVYCSSPLKIAEKDDILLSVRAPVGPTNLSPGHVCIGRGLTAIRPNENLELKYLLYFFKYFEAQLQRKGTGTTFRAITQNVVKNLEIPLLSIPEQRRIVSRIEKLLSQLDSGVETLNTVMRQLAAYRYTALKETFSAFPLNVPFGEIMTSNLGKMLDKAKNQGTPRKYVRNANVRWFSFDLSDLLEMRISDSETERYSIQQGDLVICEGGEPGRCAVWNGAESVFFQKALHRVRFKKACNPKFYMYYLWFAAQSDTLKHYFTGSGIKHLTGDSLKKVPVPFSDIAQQNDAVRDMETKLSVCDSIEQTVNAALRQSEAMRQSILKRAFEGEL